METRQSDDPTLGARLRQLRKANGWKLADVADRTGLSVSFLSDVERGRTDPSLNTLRTIADVYQMRVVIAFTKVEGSMDKLHRCEAMPADVEIWRPPQRRGRWRLYVMRGFCYIRFCPFCGVELKEGENAS
jgi:transcriptional regulator with XRE-family HTH domain